MKRSAFIRHLTGNGCYLARDGRRHEVWRYDVTGRQDSVPRHSELDNYLVRTICKRLGIPDPPG